MPPPIQSPIRLLVAFCWLATACQGSVAEEPIRIVALGDSLTAGPGLAADSTFPVKLEAALRARGHSVTVVDAGVSGDTARDGLARLDWSVGPDADAVIVELGANDALRGTDPAITRAALDDILARLSDRGLPVLLAGMIAPPNLGDSYAAAFNPIYAELAEKHGAELYPFFLDGVAGDSKFNLEDGMHPNAEGVDIIVERILGSVEAVIARVDESRRSRNTRDPPTRRLAMPRLFTGIEIPAAIGEQLSYLRGGLPGARWIDRENYHLTLRFVGDVDMDVAEEIAEGLARVRRPAFTLTLSHLGTLGTRKPHAIVVKPDPSAELLDLKADHERVMQRIGLPPDTRKFTPHVTLARLRGAVSRDIARYLTLRGGFVAGPFPVGRFVLYSARQSIGGGPYVVEESYPLGRPRTETFTGSIETWQSS